MKKLKNMSRADAVRFLRSRLNGYLDPASDAYVCRVTLWACKCSGAAQVYRTRAEAIAAANRRAE